MKMQILSLCVSRYSIHNTFIHFILLCFCISLAASGCTCSTKNYMIFFAKIENQKQQFKKKGRVRICQQILIVSLISFNKIFVCILLSSSQCTQFLREISFFLYFIFVLPVDKCVTRTRDIRHRFLHFFTRR
jgi:hypothetical protein